MAKKGKTKSSTPCPYGHRFVTSTSDKYMICLDCITTIKTEDYKVLLAKQEAKRAENA